jgi:hypothetical protein
MAMGLERSVALLAKLDGIEAYLTFNDENNIPQVFVTEGFGTGSIQPLPADGK